MKHKVFVYGSLLSGLHNHRFLEGSTLLYGYDVLLPDGNKWALISLGAFPGLVRAPQQEYPMWIEGETYEVSDETLARLDRLEGHPSHYKREQVETCVYEGVWVYVYQNPHGFSRELLKCSWKGYLKQQGKYDVQ